MVNSYSKIEGGNFGDYLNEFLWDKLLPRSLNEYRDENTIFLGIGTRLRPEILDNDPRKKIVFGTGYGYSKKPPIVDSTWEIKCVRGPKTAEALRIDKSYAITDSAILIKEIINPPIQKKFKYGFIPHHSTIKEDDWESVCENLNFKYINPKRDPMEVIKEITSCEYIISESLHGAIIADAYRIPWVAIKTRSTINNFKWQDWAESLELEFIFLKIPPLYNLSVRNNKSKLKYLLKVIFGKFISKHLAIKKLKEIKSNSKNFKVSN